MTARETYQMCEHIKTCCR